MRKLTLSIFLSAIAFITQLTAQTTSCSNLGSISFQKWNNISGTSISSLTSNVNFPSNPSSRGTRTSFEIASNSGNNYGLRVQGFLCPPTTGSYTFWIAGDDNVELYLSTNNLYANRVRIAYHTGNTTSRQWNKYATQKSVAINLVANTVYYIEAIVKEGSGSDNMAVGWATPGQSTTSPSQVIPGTRLMRDFTAPVAPSGLSAANIAQTTLTLNWSAATDDIQTVGYDIYRNGTKLNTVPITSTTYNVSGLTASTAYSFYVRALDAAGNVSGNSSTLNVTTLGSGPTDTQAPSAPTALTANSVTQSSLSLSWTASTDNIGVTGYDVFRDGVKVNVSNVTGTSFNVTGLSPSTTYAFTVRARDAAGNLSVASAALNVTTGQGAIESFTQRTVISNQSNPWDLVWGPDNNIWYTERTAGRVSFVVPSTGVKRVVLTLGSNMARSAGQDGLMGLAIHPEFNTGKPFVYIAYTYQVVSATVRRTRIQRYTYNPTTQLLETPVTVLENIPGSNDHNSGRLAIGPDLKLYYTVGDMGAGQFDNASRTNNAQNLNILEGKVLRLNTEPVSSSWLPTDNPNAAQTGDARWVYSLGHRNPQGLVWGNVNGTNRLYSSEHGPYSDDEVNVIEPGRNYGWPQVIGFCDGNYNGRTTGGFAISNEQNNCTSLNAKVPIRSIYPAANPPTDATSYLTWPSTAPSGMDFYSSTAIPGWQHSLLITNLKAGMVTRFKLSNDGNSIISDTMNYFRGNGRYRDLIVSPDGLKIYIVCDSSGATSGPTGGTVNSPPNPGSILEFTYVSPGARLSELYEETDVQNKFDKTVDVYPNPAGNFVIVYNYKIDDDRTIEIYNLNGQQLKSERVVETATRLDVQDLTTGLYMIRIVNSQGELISVEKLMVVK